MPSLLALQSQQHHSSTPILELLCCYASPLPRALQRNIVHIKICRVFQTYLDACLFSKQRSDCKQYYATKAIYHSKMDPDALTSATSEHMVFSRPNCLLATATFIRETICSLSRTSIFSEPFNQIIQYLNSLKHDKELDRERAATSIQHLKTNH